jgi:uncharacterized protein (TIGR03437 family)
VHTLRDTSGQVVAGTVIFDVNHRFPGEATFTGLHIHDGVAGQNGGVTINTGLSGTNSVVTTSGSGNIFRIVNVNNQAGLATLNSLVRNPENHYVNLHTTVHPGGAVRSQLLPANTAAPSIGAIISAVSEPTLRTVAPGGLMTIFGTNLVKAPTDLSGWAGDSVPLSLNGVQATIAGTRAPILIVDRDHLVVQVPNEVSAGAQPVVVTNPNGATASSTVTVAASAPGIFFGPLGAVALRNSDYSVIGPDNPARAGDLLLIYATGFGQPTTPTGRVTPFTDPLPRKSGVRATLGGRDVDVIYALSSPGLVGVDQFVIRVAEGIPAGNANLVVRIGDATSNTVTVAVR